MSDDNRLLGIPQTWGDLCEYILPASGASNDSSFKTSTSSFTPLEGFNQPLFHDFVQVDQDIPDRLLTGYIRWLNARNIRDTPLDLSFRYSLRNHIRSHADWRSEAGTNNVLYMFRDLLNTLFEDVALIEGYADRLRVANYDPNIQNTHPDHPLLLIDKQNKQPETIVNVEMKLLSVLLNHFTTLINELGGGNFGDVQRNDVTLNGAASMLGKMSLHIADSQTRSTEARFGLFLTGDTVCIAESLEADTCEGSVQTGLFIHGISRVAQSPITVPTLAPGRTAWSPPCLAAIDQLKSRPPLPILALLVSILLSGLESTAALFPVARPTKRQGLEDLPGIPLRNLPDEDDDDDDGDDGARKADPDYKFYDRRSTTRTARQEESSDSTETVRELVLREGAIPRDHRLISRSKSLASIPFPIISPTRLLRKSAASHVWLAKSLSPVAALLIAKFYKTAMMSQLEREQEVYECLFGQGITPNYYGTFIAAGGSYGCLVLEYLTPMPSDLFWPSDVTILSRLYKKAEMLHRQGFQHGDIAPRNVVLDRHQDVRLIDFQYAQHHACKGAKRCPELVTLRKELSDSSNHVQWSPASTQATVTELI